MFDLVIIILNYNTHDLLRECLQSLRKQAGLQTQSDLRFEVCVVDNASPDDSADMVAREFPKVKLIRSPVNGGYPAGNNLGLRAYGFPDKPHARYAMLLNPDTLVPQGALAQMVRFADANPDVGVVGPKLLLMDGTLDKACRRSFPTPEVSFYRFSGLGKLFPNSKRFGRYNMTYLGIDEQADIDSVVGACMLVRAEALTQTGLLDEQFFMYGEDLDWCLRIKQAGYRVVYYPSVTVHHVKRAASKASPKAQFEFQRAMWLFYKKHYRASTPRLIDFVVRKGIALRGGTELAKEIARG
jgi:GT2 family glycosyltransferase